MRKSTRMIAAAVAAALAAGASQASSHREAPNITRLPTVDATDFYLFTQLRAGPRGLRDADRELPAAAGPLRRSELLRARPRALYEIHIDNDGDARRGPDVPVPLRQPPRRNQGKGFALEGRRQGRSPCRSRTVGPGRGDGRRSLLNFRESYTLTLVRGDRRSGKARPVTRRTSGTTSSASRTTSSAPRPSARRRLRALRAHRSSTRSRFRAARRRAACSSGSATSRSR